MKSIPMATMVGIFLLFCIFEAPAAEDLFPIKSTSPTYLGTIGAKSYYYHKVSMSYSAASTYCVDQSLQLARIKTPAIQTLLASKGNLTGFAPGSGTSHNSYWVGARDALALQQFQWDDGTDVYDVGQTSVGYDAYKTGITYRAGGNYNGWWYSAPLGSTFRPLCETSL